MTTQNTTSQPTIRNAADLTPGSARYWNALAKRLGSTVDVIDPWRTALANLRREYPAGTRVYRAATSGKWGKSAETVTI